MGIVSIETKNLAKSEKQGIMIVRRVDVLEHKGKKPKDDKDEKQNIDENVEEVDKDHRILDYTKEEIEEYIDKIKRLIAKGRYTIPLQANRNEGYEHEILYVFFKEYEDTFPEGHKKIQIY